MKPRKLQPESFLENCLQQADPPFCFSCGERRAYCKCKEGPLSQQEYWQLNRDDNKPKQP
jgi:hypothetical protein